MSKLEPCRECGCLDQTWFWSNTISGGIQQGRLNTSEVIPVFYLGCDICGETLSKLSADDMAAKLNTSHIPEGFALVPIKNIMKVERSSDQSVTIVTTSCRTASEIENVITAYQEGK